MDVNVCKERAAQFRGEAITTSATFRIKRGLTGASTATEHLHAAADQGLQKRRLQQTTLKPQRRGLKS
jgi:hypothetical protein